MKTGYPWPTGTQAAVTISVNFDAESYDLLSTTNERLFGRFSYGRYGVRAGLPRLLDLFAKNNIQATFFVTGEDAKRHTDELKEIAKSGHEIASRGATMKRPSETGELAWLKEGIDVVSDITGMKVQGYRSPDNELSPLTLHYLIDLGLLYDASFQDDDAPYIFDLKAGKLVEIPSCYALADAPAYSARHTHQRVLQIWRDETAALIAADALIPLTLHLRGDFGSTRAARIALLDQYIKEVKQHPGISFMTYVELAKWTINSKANVEGDPYTPHQQTLANTIYRGDLAVKPT